MSKQGKMKEASPISTVIMTKQAGRHIMDGLRKINGCFKKEKLITNK